MDSLQMDLRGANAKLVTLRSIVSGMNVPDPKRVKCPMCGLTFRSVPPLEEHVYLSHDGEEPAHWKIADARAADHEPGA